MSCVVPPEPVILTALAPPEHHEDSVKDFCGEELLEAAAADSAIIDDEPIVTRKVRFTRLTTKRRLTCILSRWQELWSYYCRSSKPDYTSTSIDYLQCTTTEIMFVIFTANA